MYTFENNIETGSRETLKSLVGRRLLNWSQPHRIDSMQARQISCEYVRLETDAGNFVMSLFEIPDDVFPDVVRMEVQDEVSWEKRIEGNVYVMHPEAWYPTRDERVIDEVRLFTDTGTDVRRDGGIIRDDCAVALVFGKESLLFEKTDTMTDVWDISRQPAGAILLTGRPRKNIVCETL